MKQKNYYLLNASKVTVDCFLSKYYSLHSEGLENLPKQGPALLIPKHQTVVLDALIVGTILYNTTGRYANYITANWPTFIEYFGGIRIVRQEDINGTKNTRKKKQLIERARELNPQAFEYIDHLFSHGEIIISFSEGCLSYKKMLPLKTGFIEKTLEIQEKKQIKIPFIPIGIEYEHLYHPRSDITVRVGKAIHSDEKELLIEILQKEIRQLSGV